MSDDQPTMFGQTNVPPAQSPLPAPSADVPTSPISSPISSPAPSPQTAPDLNPLPKSQSSQAPPTIQGPIQRPYRKVIWPEFLGSISLALGIMGVITSLLTIIPRIFMGSESFMRVWGFGAQMQSSVIKNQWFHDIATGLYLLAAIGLSIIGMLFIARNPKVVPAIKWWIPLRIIVALMYAYITIVLNNINLASLQASGAIQAQPANLVTMSTYISTSMMILWWLSFPAIFTFILISEKTRSEMARWTPRQKLNNSLLVPVTTPDSSSAP